MGVLPIVGRPRLARWRRPNFDVPCQRWVKCRFTQPDTLERALQRVTTPRCRSGARIFLLPSRRVAALVYDVSRALVFTCRHFRSSTC